MEVDGSQERCCGGAVSVPPKEAVSNCRSNQCSHVLEYSVRIAMAVSARHFQLTGSIGRVSLYLDPQIRDWVLLPITLVMVCVPHPWMSFTDRIFSDSKILVGVLRHYVVVLLQSTPKKLSRAALREQCVPLPSFIDVVQQCCIYLGGLLSDLKYFAPRLQSHLYHCYTTRRYRITFPKRIGLAHISKTVHPKLTRHCLHRILSRTQLPLTG